MKATWLALAVSAVLAASVAEACGAMKVFRLTWHAAGVTSSPSPQSKEVARFFEGGKDGEGWVGRCYQWANVYRTFLEFDLATLKGKNVRRAILRMKQGRFANGTQRVSIYVYVGDGKATKDDHFRTTRPAWSGDVTDAPPACDVTEGVRWALEQKAPYVGFLFVSETVTSEKQLQSRGFVIGKKPNTDLVELWGGYTDGQPDFTPSGKVPYLQATETSHRKRICLNGVWRHKPVKGVVPFDPIKDRTLFPKPDSPMPPVWTTPISCSSAPVTIPLAAPCCWQKPDTRSSFLKGHRRSGVVQKQKR